MNFNNICDFMTDGFIYCKNHLTQEKNNNDFIDRIQSGVKNIDSDEKKLVKTGVKVALCALFAGIVAAVAMPIPILMVPASIILVGGASALYQAWQSGSPLITSLNNL